MAKKHNNTRNFSSADSVLYNGALYPSSTVLMDNGNGVIKDSKIFMDANGQYYTMGDNGMAYPVMLQYNLPEVEVKPSQEEMLSRSLRNSLTLSQDKARVSNPLNPYENFNTHLRERALRGANEHAIWDKEHPNLASWRDFATAIPFGVASIPLAGGLGETALGQAALKGMGRVMSNPIVETANSALGLGMAVEGAKDLKQGKFTPMTLLDLSGAIMPAKGIVNYIDRAASKAVKARNLSREVQGLSTLDEVPTIATEEVPSLGIESSSRQPWELPTEPLGISRETRALPSPEPRRGLPTLTQEENIIESVDDFPNTLPIDHSMNLLDAPDYNIDAALSRMREGNVLPYNGRNPNQAFEDEVTLRNPNGSEEFVPIAAANPYDRMPEFLMDHAYRRIINNKEAELLANAPEGRYAYNESPLDFVTPIVPRRQVNPSVGESSTSLQRSNIRHIKPRDTRNGEPAYTTEEINALVNEDGTLKEGVEFDRSVRTGAHGVSSWYSLFQSPTTTLKNHLHSIDPATSRREMKSIMRSNPQGRSGILIKTKPGDTSVDSTPLAYKMATRLGTRFKPLAGSEYGDRVRSNLYGINNYFKESGEEANRARALFQENPDAEATLMRDANGNITGMQLTDANGDFIIPLRSRQEVLDIMNKQLHNFNKHYGTSYSDILPSNYDSEGNLRPWDFGEEFDLPNIYGISYKRGGKLCKRRGLTF